MAKWLLKKLEIYFFLQQGFSQSGGQVFFLEQVLESLEHSFL